MEDERALLDIYLARTREELGQLADAGFLTAGYAFAPVLLVKGVLNAAECDGAPLLSGADGSALQAALGRLGYLDDAWAACSTIVRSGSSWVTAEPEDLAWAVEVFDPELVIGLDTKASEALMGAWALTEPLVPGAVGRVRGRRVLNLGGFEAALADPQAKQLMWARLKQVPPLGAPL